MNVKFARAVLCIAIAVFDLAGARALHAAPRVLVYQRNGKGYLHDNLAASATAIRELGAANGFEVEVTTNAAVFSDDKLKSFAALIFANSNNEAFENDEQRAAFQRFIRRGGGFVGVHSSTGSERNWDYFQKVQGAKFLRHAPMQKFNALVVDAKDPTTAHLKSNWERTDECYFFTNLNPGIHVLLAADVGALKDPKLQGEPGQKVNGVFPLAWRQQFDGGREFYTSLGHKIEHYSDPVFRQHLLAGIQWALGKTKEPAQPTSIRIIQ